jgi:hypothetical protein
MKADRNIGEAVLVPRFCAGSNRLGDRRGGVAENATLGAFGMILVLLSFIKKEIRISSVTELKLVC